MSQQNLAQLVDRLEKVVARLETVDVRTPAAAAPAPAAQSGGAGSPAVADFESYMADYIAPFLELSKKIGGEALAASEIVKKAFDAQHDFIALAVRCKKPSIADLQKLLQPTSDQINAAGTLNSKTRGEFVNHTQSVAAGLSALGWVTIEKTPAPYIKEMLSSAQFYSNKILVAYKGKDQQHFDWAKSFSNVLIELEAYVKRNFLTGITWNPAGEDPMAVSGGAAAKPAESAGGAPPPPPPPPAGFMDDVKASSSKPGAASAVFAEINKGNVTSGLRHVTKDMKTKNQPRSESQPVPDRSAAPKPASKPKEAAAAKKGTPKFALDGNKWLVEYQDGNKEIIIEETSLQQTVYIYRCNNSVVQIKGKINCITIDDCSRCGVVFESAVSSCEAVNSKNVEIQCTGKVPCVSIDKCSGVQLYVNKDSLDVSIVSSKSDQMNVLRVKEDGDVEEVPIPEQYCTLWDSKANKWVTAVSSHV